MLFNTYGSTKLILLCRIWQEWTDILDLLEIKQVIQQILITISVAFTMMMLVSFQGVAQNYP